MGYLRGLWPRAVASPRQPPLISGFATQLRENERIWAGFRALELRMLAAGTLREALAVLTHELPGAFPAVQAVSLAWLDPEYELARQLEHEGDDTGVAASLLSLDAETLARHVPRVPRLGPLTADEQRRFFPKYPRTLGSLAVAPLVLRGEQVGSLNQASEDPRHYTPDAATDLLEHLAAVTAICIDNAVNRARLQRDGLTDALTGIANRRFFERRLHQELSLWKRHGGDLSCLLVDLDHFKQINDRYGHQVGDFALQQVAQLLSDGLRSSDVLARYGGEEFVLLLPATDAACALEIAERLRQRIATAQWLVKPALRLSLTVSIGLATLEPTAASRDETRQGLLQSADAALYAAKAQGRNRVACVTTLSQTP